MYNYDITYIKVIQQEDVLNIINEIGYSIELINPIDGFFIKIGRLLRIENINVSENFIPFDQLTKENVISIIKENLTESDLSSIDLEFKMAIDNKKRIIDMRKDNITTFPWETV
jgi:hypothetical protein